MITVTKRDLIELGYGPSFAADIIKKDKGTYGRKGAYLLSIQKIRQGSKRSR